MSRYPKWALTLGILCVTPSLVMAGPLSFLKLDKFKKPAATAQRSNQAVAEDIAKALRAAKLTGFDIEIKYKQGQATLLGKIADARQKQKASQVVGSVAGVRRVNNQLAVLQAGQPTKPFAAPKQQIAAQPRPAIPTTPPTAGRLPAAITSQPTAAPVIETAALETDAASPINKVIPVAGQKPASSNQQLAQSVATALGEAQLTGYDIEIRAKNGVVTLGGAVMTPQERVMVSQVVSRVPGVKNVANQLTLMAPQAMPQFPQSPMGQSPFGPGPIMPASFQAGAPAPGAGNPAIPAPPAYGHPGRGASHTVYDMPNLPNYAWPSYASYPNYAQLSYPKQYSASAWPYIGPFYPYPQIPLGWRQVQLEWDDGHWNLNFRPRTDRWFWFLKPENW